MNNLVSAAVSSNEAQFKGFVLVIHSFFSSTTVSQITEKLQERIPKYHIVLKLPDSETDAIKLKLLTSDNISGLQSQLAQLELQATALSQPKAPPTEPKEVEDAPPEATEPPVDEEEQKAKQQKLEQEIMALKSQM